MAEEARIMHGAILGDPCRCVDLTSDMRPQIHRHRSPRCFRDPIGESLSHLRPYFETARTNPRADGDADRGVTRAHHRLGEIAHDS